MHIFFPILIGHIAFAQHDVQIAITDMSINLYRNREGIFFTDVHNLFNSAGDFIHGHNHVVGQGNLTYEANGLLAVAAHSPDTVVGLQHIHSTCFLAQIAKLLHLGVQLFLGEGFHGDNYINTGFIMGSTLEFNIIRSCAHIGVIHVFDAGGVDACLIDFSNKGKCHMGVFKHSQHIKAIRRHGLQLQGNLRDDAQGTLAAHHELLHAVASGAFFQASAHFHDFALRSNHFQAINLITGYAIAHCLVATSISCQISTNHAGLSAAGIARIEEAGVIGHFLDIHGAHACFGNYIHALGIHFNNLVQAFH